MVDLQTLLYNFGKMDVKSYIEGVTRRIKETRLKKGISQKSIADHLNIVASAYLRIERGQTELRLSTILQICEFMEIDFRDILQLEKVGETSDQLKEIGHLNKIVDLQDSKIIRLEEMIKELSEKNKV